MVDLRSAYKVLGLEDGAPAEAVTKAWRRSSLDCHPDKRPGDAAAAAKFTALTRLKDLLLSQLTGVRRGFARGDDVTEARRSTAATNKKAVKKTCPKQHPLKAMGTKMDDGWACSARKTAPGCKSSITDFNQTEGMNRFTCKKCEFDLCEKCYKALGEQPKQADRPVGSWSRADDDDSEHAVAARKRREQEAVVEKQRLLAEEAAAQKKVAKRERREKRLLAAEAAVEAKRARGTSQEHMHDAVECNVAADISESSADESNDKPGDDSATAVAFSDYTNSWKAEVSSRGTQAPRRYLFLLPAGELGAIRPGHSTSVLFAHDAETKILYEYMHEGGCCTVHWTPTEPEKNADIWMVLPLPPEAPKAKASPSN